MVPLLNPDGMIFGNQVLASTGHRQHHIEDKSIGPEMFYLHRLVSKWKQNGMVFEMHCHLDDSLTHAGCWGETAGFQEDLGDKIDLFKLLDAYGYFFEISRCRFLDKGPQNGKTREIEKVKESMSFSEVSQISSGIKMSFNLLTSSSGGPKNGFEMENYNQIGRTYCHVFGHYLLLKDCEKDKSLVRLVDDRLLSTLISTNRIEGTASF